MTCQHSKMPFYSFIQSLPTHNFLCYILFVHFCTAKTYASNGSGKINKRETRAHVQRNIFDFVLVTHLIFNV